MAKSKNRKKKKKINQQVKIKPANYIRKHARKLPIHECLIREDWEASKFSPVVISRQKSNGDIIMASYIVDMKCLGVKNTFFGYDFSTIRYRETIKEMEYSMDINFVPIESTLAHNIIYGAVEFAEDCGFEPHKDFTSTTEYLLDKVESIEYLEVAFGDDEGKPYFIAGPHDDSEKIMATLNKTVGAGNFHYIAEVAAPDGYMDYEDTNPLMTKQEILDTYLPNEKVDAKMRNFELESHKAAFIPQIICAGLILEEVEGQIHLLEDAYEQEGFLESVLEKLANSFAASQGIAVNDIEEEILNELDNLVIFLTEKLVEFGSTDFLFEKAYTPIPKEVTNEEIKQMTEEELDAHQEHRLFYMTQMEKYFHILNEYAYYYISVEHKDANFKDVAVQQSIIDQFITQAKSEHEIDAQIEKDYRESCQKVIDTFFLNPDAAKQLS